MTIKRKKENVKPKKDRDNRQKAQTGAANHTAMNFQKMVDGTYGKQETGSAPS